MPELPDVEVFRRYLQSTSLRQTIKRASVRSDDLLGNVPAAKLERELKGQRFRSTHRHGKRLFVRVKENGWLVLHFGMTGFLKYFKKAEGAPGHTRLLIEFRNGYHLAYDCQRKLGEINWTEDVADFIREKKLGPDALRDVKLETFHELLSGSRGTIKGALMNQRLLAGLGNIYADEALFHAGIHPQARAHQLSDQSRKKLFRSVKKVLRKAIACRVDPERFPRSYLLPHRDKDGRCPRCRGPLDRIKVSGRTTYFCPNHQKK